ncbi:MAG: tRNA dimethylallyltransferase [Elusimicrobia bacterium]|nr:MAG: tRNA dimethylallyltransferase [Elusimicrobiota bacterium]KAF0156489.1 MAG: tRNA dimethylallyltransferase [Elusimicrobiota bacterium]
MGATASGKTEAALGLARLLDGEVISADSRQVYKRLTAGTAKPDGTWRGEGAARAYLVEGVPYHLVDFLDPKSSYDAASFAADANRLIEEIKARGKVPIITGGTGMYVQALWSGLDPLPPADPAVRAELTAFAEREGRPALHAQLTALDPEAAARIPVNNIQRVIRALEVIRISGRRISELWTGRFHQALPTHLARFIIISWPKKDLLERVRARTLANFVRWEAETRALLDEGYPEDCPALKSLGYPQMIDYIRGADSQAATAEKIVRVTMSYAKRQATWFGRYRNALRVEASSPDDLLPGKLIKTAEAA